MMKLHLVVFLAMCVIVVSYPVNEEKRMDELKGLLRELLLIDFEEESRLENSKRFLSSQVGVDDEVSDKVCDMFDHFTYSYIAVRLSSTKQWEVVGTGDQGAGSLPTSESTIASFNEIKEKYLLPDQPVIVFVIRNTPPKRPLAAIVWDPKPQNGAMIRISLQYSDLGTAVLQSKVEADCWMHFDIIRWREDSDINYSQVFE